MIDLTTVIQAVLTVLVAVAMRWLVPWLKSRTSETQRQNLEAWVRIAVAFAQQVYYQNSGEERMANVLAFLESKGFDIDSDEVRAAIEAEVLKLHQGLTA